MSANQRPSVGRIVHYQSYGTSGGEFTSIPCAAIITEVEDDETVGVCVLDPSGIFFNGEIKYADPPTPGCWSWPPYVAPKA